MSHSISHDIIQIVDAIIHVAVDRGASDIHLESQESGLRVRFRVDGLLYDHQVIDHVAAAHIIARVKVLAHIDVAQTRIAQDGKVNMTYKNKLIDLTGFALFFGAFSSTFLIESNSSDSSSKRFKLLLTHS